MVPAVTVTRRPGLLTAPEPRRALAGGRYRRACVCCVHAGWLWARRVTWQGRDWPGMWRGGGACAGGGCVCLVLQARAGRLGKPDAEPTGGIIGLDTPPPGQRTDCQLACDCQEHGGSSAVHSTGGGPCSLTAICTGGATYGWTFRPQWWGLAGGGAPGRAERCPALEPTLAQRLGGGAAVGVNRGGRRAHHPSYCSRAQEGGGGGQIKRLMGHQ